MASPLVETKLYPPKLRRSLVARPRLSGRLGRGGESRLTLVSAPAGFGKTTLLAEWLAATPTERSVAWLSLDESDSQPASYWTYLITALQAVAPGVGASALPLLQSAQAPIETVLTTVLNDLGSVPNDIYLVLDDYHLVDGPDIQAGMTFLLERLPPRAHLVVSTREDPALPLARLRASGELVEVRAADLRFTLDEAAVYLNDVTGLDLVASDIAALEGAPKAGSPRSSWPRCRCRDETTSPASSPGSPGTTGTSSTTSSKRSWDGNPPTSAASWSRPPSWTG
jgi:LuxR family transcriptional regulator, maltose regulon positive regulatory protein